MRLFLNTNKLKTHNELDCLFFIFLIILSKKTKQFSSFNKPLIKLKVLLTLMNTVYNNRLRNNLRVNEICYT